MLIDAFNRRIDYLRLSLTRQCNFRCLYCMPNTPEVVPGDPLVPLDAMLKFVKIAIDKGVKKIRLTGGEPLTREGVADFVAAIHAYAPSVELALTTNGALLARHAEALKKAGLGRVNISLDSLKRERFAKIAQRDMLGAVLEGIERAIAAGLGVKLNAVALRGLNDDELLDLINFAHAKGVMMRFIEFMENTHAYGDLKGLAMNEILSIVRQKYEIYELEKPRFGPARIFAIKGLKLGSRDYCFGLIAPHNDEFCQSCNRIRMTAEGVICPCLYFQEAVDLRPALNAGDSAEIESGLLKAVSNKPEKNEWGKGEVSERAFYHTGG